MLNQRKLLEILDDLVNIGVIHAGQRQDVLNRGNEQARHLGSWTKEQKCDA